MTRRDLQNAAKDLGRPWDWGKGFDHSAPIGPIHPVASVGHVDSRAASGSPSTARTKQDSDISKLIWPISDVISIASRSMELRPGDLIMTGTPEGVGPVKPGQTMTVGIDRLGEITIHIGS